MKPFKTLVDWFVKQSGNWALMEPTLYKKKNGAYPDTPGGTAVRANSLMIKHKYYQDPNLTIDKFCSQIDVNRCYLSRAINRVYGVNFAAWVNIFRVDEAKRILQEADIKTINMEDLAFRCGYNSARSFIRAFSAREECTPRQYYRKLKLRKKEVAN